MRRPTLPDLASYLAVHTWPTLKGHYTPDCCIAGASVCMAVLEYFAYPSREIEVVCTAINKTMWEMTEIYIKAGGKPGPWSAEQIAKLEQSEAFQIIIGHPKAGEQHNKIGTHLIVETWDDRGNKFYIDPTITQCDRPERNIHVPFGTAFPASTWTDRGAAFSNGKGTYFLYVRHPRPDPSYKSSPDWRGDRWFHLAGRLIREAKENAA